MAELLTKKKQAWANQFKPDQLTGPPLVPNAGDSAKFYKRLAILIDRMTTEAKKELEALFEEPHAKEYFATDASIASQARILTNKLIDKFDTLFGEFSDVIAERLVDDVNKSSSATLHMSIRDLSGGLSLSTRSITPAMKQIIKAATTESVGLIKSIPSQYMTNIQGAVMRSITTGNGLADLVPYLNRYKGVTLRRARLIASDQTSKTYSALTKGRMEEIGLDDYVWRHTPGSRYPRHEHERMDGNVYSFKNPPVIDSKTGERGIPGQLIHCNCRMQPIVKFKGE